MRLIHKILFCLLVGNAAVSIAASSDFDPTFGNNGLLVTGLGEAFDNFEYGTAVLAQPDGKIVVFGATSGFYGWEIALSRLDTSGNLDPTFGTGGTLPILVSNNFSYQPSALLQSDGKIVLTGECDCGDADSIALLRLNSDGTFDNTFGEDGRAQTAASSGSYTSLAVTQQADGKLVVVGSWSDNAFLLARYNSDGTLDTSFDSDGIVTTDVGSGKDKALSVLQQADGKLLVTGLSSNTSSYTDAEVVILRYNADGSLDNNFGSNGIFTPVSGPSPYGGIAQQNDGKLLFYSGSSNTITLMRLNTDGTLDSTFDTDGIVSTDLAYTSEWPVSVLQQQDDKILLLANANNETYVFVRYNTDGSLDTTFNGSGIVESSTNNGLPGSPAFAIDASGKLIVTGTGGGDIHVIRHDADGSIDTGFGNSGIASIDIMDQPTAITGLILNDNHQLIVGGSEVNAQSTWVDNIYNNDLLLARLAEDGVLDVTYGVAGISSTDLGRQDFFRDLIFGANNSVIAAGFTSLDPTSDIVIAKYNADGSPDTTFGNNGKLLTSVGPDYDYAYALTQQSDGKLVVVGGTSVPTNSKDVFVIRLLADGTLDTTFGNNGVVIIATAGSKSAVDVVQLSNEKLLIAAGDMLRLNADGSLDVTFDNDGIKTSFESCTKLLLQSDDKVLVGGSSGHGDHDDLFVARFNPDWTPDTTFASSGITYVHGVRGLGSVSDLLITDGGAIAMAGTVDSTWSINSNIAVAMFEPNGNPYPGFGTDGVQIIDSGYHDEAIGIVQQADGKLVIGGRTLGPIRLMLARLAGEFPDDDTDWISNTNDAFPANAAASLDEDNDGLPDAWNVDCDATCQSNSGLTLDSYMNDSDNDGVDNDNDAFPLDATKTLPLAGFTSNTQLVGEGSLVTVTIALTGNVVAYPVTIPMQLDGVSTAVFCNPGPPCDHDAETNTVSIASDANPANTGSYQFVAGDDGLGGEPDRTVIFNLVNDNGLNTLANAEINTSAAQHTVTITELNVQPTISSLSFEQDGEAITQFSALAGPITITATMSDPNPLDEVTLSWSASGQSLNAYASGNMLVIDPADLPKEGITVTLTVIATDNGTPPMDSEPYVVTLKQQSGGGSSGGGAPSPWTLLALMTLDTLRKRYRERMLLH